MQPIQDYDYPFYGKTDTIITLLRRTLNYNVRAQNMVYHLFFRHIGRKKESNLILCNLFFTLSVEILVHYPLYIKKALSKNEYQKHFRA